MTPLEQAQRLYVTQPCGRTFEQDVATFLRIGVVFSTGTAFLMAKPVPSPMVSTSFIYADPEAVADRSICDTWLIWIAAGDMGEFFRFAPFRLDWLAWARKGVIRWHSFNRTERLCNTSTSTKHVGTGRSLLSSLNAT